MAYRLDPTPTPKELRQQADFTGVYDILDVDDRCKSAVVIKGEGYQCSLRKEHGGWAHQSLEAEALWR